MSQKEWLIQVDVSKRQGLQQWQQAHQNHADANRHPQDGGDEGNLGRLPGLVVLGQVRLGSLAGKAVAKKDRLCTDSTC